MLMNLKTLIVILIIENEDEDAFNVFDYFRFMRILHQVNQDHSFVQECEFYLDLINDEEQKYFDLKQSYLIWLQNMEVPLIGPKKNTILDYPFIIDVAIKADILQYEFQREQKLQ